jgi:hypothetical protein
MAIFLLAAGGAADPVSCAADDPAGPQPAFQTTLKIRRILSNSGRTLAYDALMEVYGLMTGSSEPIPELGRLLAEMIQKKNADPRVDQMILIFAARVIGQSRFPISNVTGLFDAIISQEMRINEWVISFVADAMASYPVDLAEGDRLMADVEALVRRVRHRSNDAAENFGHHFLPPPKIHSIRDYIHRLPSTELRQLERNRYYALIRSGIAEADIAASLDYLQRSGLPGSGRTCVPAMQCLIRHRTRIPFH